MNERILKDPEPSQETEAFWEAAKEKKLLVKSCTTCGKAHWYPRDHCPFCGSMETEWIEAKGTGKIYSYSIMRRADPVYTMAYVTLDEGPTMMTNIVDCDPETISIGDPVRVEFKRTEGGYLLPMFTPILSEAK